MNHNLSTFYDVQQLLKKFGFIIYFKDKNDMYEMMEQEIHFLFQYKLISKDEYLKSRLIINQRRNE
ncbi:YqgQ family protein [Staphylococcus gallinarum]|uniref:YqgQ family protein n=1 Tax=Staphylococcus gallinarum TaxID=1293 RepID=UPI001E417F1C|nr:YqgQ family protein [Staphylococcus gallinarum]MCD8828111.1 YqgQ family protein [Staphylococcus gallinarum]MDN6412791.1 YqgQ family protein [Staphylococcus gallinarum]MEB6055103.1 YqgQ family protein [Staphylococcus gallinarum]